MTYKNILFSLAGLFLTTVISTNAAYALNNNQFIAVSDIHFDPFATCNEATDCVLIDKLRHAPATEWDNILSKQMHQAPQYDEDTNYTLFKSAITELTKRSHLTHPKFVIILGDFIAHSYIDKFKKFSSDKSQAAYQAFVKKTYDYLTLQLNKAFPNVDVFPVIGNHESYKGSYSFDRNDPLFTDLRKTWSALIKDPQKQKELQKTFSTAGYYSINLTEHHLKIIALNTLLFSPRVHGTQIEKAIQEQFDWLHHELQFAAERHQKVLIIEHIPSGVDVFSSLQTGQFSLINSFKAEYNARFDAEIQQFAPHIAGIIAGHFHTDWFQALTYDQQKVAVTGVPAISPIAKNNPGYKIYEYSPVTQQLQNYQTYYYPFTITDAWSFMYDFNDMYQPNCHDCSLINGMENIQKTGYLADQYIYNFDLRNQSQIANYWLPYYWCDIFNVKATDYQQCLSSTA